MVMYRPLQPQVDGIIAFTTSLLAVGGFLAMLGSLGSSLTTAAATPSLLPQTDHRTGKAVRVRKVTVECSICGKVVEVGEYDTPTRSEALKRHLKLEHSRRESDSTTLLARTAWLTREQREELEERYGAVAVRWAEEATRPGDMAGAEAAASYYYDHMRAIFGA
jgi:hypothetical protein